MFFVCVTRSNVNPAMGFSFLFAMVSLFKAYFGGDVNESRIRNNFTIVYELLDETMDHGKSRAARSFKQMHTTNNNNNVLLTQVLFFYQMCPQQVTHSNPPWTFCSSILKPQTKR